MDRRLGLAFLVACKGSAPASPPPTPPPLREIARGELHAPADFAGIADRAQRSQALFTESARVLLHPRCVNCHPDGDTPHQLGGTLHDPPATRGPHDRGVAGMECATCHQDRNQQLTRVPGAPDWHLAPIAMAWQGRSVAAICTQIKDPQRNGGKTLAQIVDHSAHDPLVGWGWAPGANRESAPGTQARFGELVAAWVETGAECPSERTP